jgi:hypothetical protein
VGSAESFCDVPAGHSIGKANIGDEKIDRVAQKQLERAVARRGLKRHPSFLLQAEDDVRTHKPIVLDYQNG